MATSQTSRMNPLNPNSFRHKFNYVNGITLHYVDEGGERNDALILCHGFPDLWYGWRYQIPFLVGKGYRVIAPDLRGYGQTDAPRCPPNDLAMYGLKNVCQDLAELMDQLNIRKATYIGHDWGGTIVWRMALYHPNRVRAIISICTPFTPPTDNFYNLDALVARLPQMAYQQYLVSPRAEIELNNDVSEFFRGILRSSKPEDSFRLFDGKNYLGHDTKVKKSSFISDEEFDYHVAQYKAHGFHGGLNWYKQGKINYQDEKGLPKKIHHPCLMITAGKDIVLSPNLAEKMPNNCSNLTIKHIEESSHWLMLEQPQLLNRHIGEFLDKLKTRDEKSKL